MRLLRYLIDTIIRTLLERERRKKHVGGGGVPNNGLARHNRRQSSLSSPNWLAFISQAIPQNLFELNRKFYQPWGGKRALSMAWVGAKGGPSMAWWQGHWAWKKHGTPTPLLARELIRRGGRWLSIDDGGGDLCVMLVAEINPGGECVAPLGLRQAGAHVVVALRDLP